MKNKEHYIDSTACKAIGNLTKEERQAHKLINAILSLCDLAGFRLESKITLRNKKTGRIWR